MMVSYHLKDSNQLYIILYVILEKNCAKPCLYSCMVTGWCNLISLHISSSLCMPIGLGCLWMCVLVSVLYLQDPTTSNAAMPRCNSSGMTANTMRMTVNCALNADFSKQISNAVKYSSYLGHAVSVQTSSGDILGCGRFDRHFPVNAEYNGHIVLEQYSRYHLTIIRPLSDLDIFQSKVLEGITGTCSSEAAIFDPWMYSPMSVGRQQTPDQFAIGDLPNRQVAFYYLQAPLIGSATILGHAVCTTTTHDSNFYSQDMGICTV